VRAASLWCCLGLTAAIPTVARTQDPAARAPAADTFIVVLPSRSPEAILADRERARRVQDDAETRGADERARTADYGARIETKKLEIDAADARVKTAKKQKQDADRATAESEKRVLERQRGVLERQRDLHNSLALLAQAEADWAAASVSALDLEMQLVSRRTQAGGTIPSGTGSVVGELERRTLEAQRNQEDKRALVSSRRSDAIAGQIELIKALAFAAGVN